MRRRIRRHLAVADDVIGIASYIAQDSLAAALRFIDSTEATLNWLLQHPGSGSPRDFDHPLLANVRSWAVKGFRNYLVFYEVEPNGIYVLAIVHGARDLPRALESRIA